MFEPYTKLKNNIFLMNFNKKKHNFDIFTPSTNVEEIPTFTIENDINYNRYKSSIQSRSNVVDENARHYLQYIDKFENVNRKQSPDNVYNFFQEKLAKNNRIEENLELMKNSKSMKNIKFKNYNQFSNNNISSYADQNNINKNIYRGNMQGNNFLNKINNKIINRSDIYGNNFVNNSSQLHPSITQISFNTNNLLNNKANNYINNLNMNSLNASMLDLNDNYGREINTYRSIGMQNEITNPDGYYKRFNNDYIKYKAQQKQYLDDNYKLMMEKQTAKKKLKGEIEINPYNEGSSWDNFGKSDLVHNPILNPENNFNYNKYIDKETKNKNKMYINNSQQNDIRNIYHMNFRNIGNNLVKNY